jgi:predicted RNA-binding Zn-ribbon protein involved in translation (DUF1610 family)
MFSNLFKDTELVDFEATCPMCGKKQVIKVHPVSLVAYENGALVQDAFANLTPAERETIVSGICPDCFSELFDSETEDA